MLYFVKNIHKITKLYYSKGAGLETLKTLQQDQGGSLLGMWVKLFPSLFTSGR